MVKGYLISEVNAEKECSIAADEPNPQLTTVLNVLGLWRYEGIFSLPKYGF